MNRVEPPPPSGLVGGNVVLTVAAWIALGLTVVFAGLTTWHGISFSYQETCGPNPPTEWRQEVTYIGLGIWFLLAIPALVLLLRARQVPTIVSLVLSIVGIFVSFVTMMLPLFAAGLC
jgi:mannose/fructose/N-acetylgalactosamine-specific phosphotransferase system component IID